MTPEKTPAPAEKAPRQRSPNYPGISLSAAVEKIAAWFKADGIVTSSRQAAMRHMGTGDAGRIFSALKSFGLISEDDGRVRLTQRGIDIVARKPDDQKRQQSLKEAALSPAVYAQILNEFPSGLPSDATLESELVASKGFNPKAVGAFLRDFRSTLEFVGISELPAVDSDSQDSDEDEEQPPKNQTKAGDFVQWESGGVLQFVMPRRVTGISEDGDYIFVEGSKTGIPAKEVTVVENAIPVTPAVKAAGTVPPIQSKNGQQTEKPELWEERFSLTEGTVAIRWPASLSPESFQDLSAWLDILKRKMGRSVPFKVTKRDVIAKLRAGCAIDGDPDSDTPCGLVDPTQTGIDSGILIPAEMLRELLDDGILKENPGHGRRLFRMP